MNELVKYSGFLVASASAACLLCASLALAKPDFSKPSFHPVSLNRPALLPEAEPAQPIHFPALTPDLAIGSPAYSPEPSPARAISQHREAIRQLELKGDAFGEALGEHSVALGNLLQAAGDHPAALSAYQKGLHIRRVGHGLHDLGQAGILSAMIRSLMALGEMQKAHEAREAIFLMQRQHYSAGDPELAMAMIAWADWNVNLLLRRESLAPRHRVMGADAPFASSTRHESLVKAHGLYIEAMEMLESRAASSYPELIAVERKLAALIYLVNERILAAHDSLSGAGFAGAHGQQASRRAMERLAAVHFLSGGQALKRAIAYSYHAPHREYASVAARIMELGDWHLLFDRRAAALDIYEEAFRMLTATEASEAEIHRIMSPGMPVQIAAVGRFHDPIRVSEYEGHIDVEFRLSKYGIAYDVEVIDVSAAGAERIRKALLRKMRGDLFRPKFVDGSPSSGEKFQLRYYYAFQAKKEGDRPSEPLPFRFSYSDSEAE